MKPTDLVKENAEDLNIGDPVIITGNVQFKGKTGDVVDFGKDRRFVIVNLYNYGKHSFQSSDVSYNDYAESGDEQEYLSQFEENKTGTIFVGQLKGTDPASKVRDRLVGEARSLQSKFEKHLAKHGYDVNEKQKYWEKKIKDIDAQIAAWDAEMERRKQGKEMTTESNKPKFQVGDHVKFLYMQKPEIWREGRVVGFGRGDMVNVQGERNEYSVHTNLLKKAKQGVTEDEYEDGNEEGFFVAIGSEEDGGFVGMVYKEGGKWREQEVAGNAPYNWGASYMGYLSPGDVMQWIRQDYGRHSRVKGPFDTEEAAFDFASRMYGLGESVSKGLPGSLSRSDYMPGAVRHDLSNIKPKKTGPGWDSDRPVADVDPDWEKEQAAKRKKQGVAEGEEWDEYTGGAPFPDTDDLDTYGGEHDLDDLDESSGTEYREFDIRASREYGTGQVVYWIYYRGRCTEHGSQTLDGAKKDIDYMIAGGFFNDPDEEARKKQRGVAEAFPNRNAGSTGTSKEDKRIAAALRKKHMPAKKKPAEQALNIGDSVIITGNSAFEGIPGRVIGFKEGKVVVDLAEHGKWRFVPERVKLYSLDNQGVAEGRVPQLSPGGADYSKHTTDQLKAMLRPGVMHRDEQKFKTLIRRELKKREQGVAEDFDWREASAKSNLQPGVPVMIWLGPRNQNPPRDDKKWWERGVVMDSPEWIDGAWRVLVKTDTKSQWPINPERVFVLKKGVAEGEYDPSYDPEYRGYSKPERNVDWDIEAKRNAPEEPKSTSTVTVRDNEGNVVLQFPSTGGYYGDLKYAANKGIDLEGGDYHANWQRNEDAMMSEASGVTSEQVASEIVRRIIFKHKDAISAFGPEAIMSAAREVGEFFAGSEELGTSDIGIATKYTLDKLEKMSQGALGESATGGATSAGAVATVPGGGKNVGSLFGGSYKQPKKKKK